MTPKLSVVLCSFNGGRTIGKTLSALKKQICTVPWELVVINDGSCDDTSRIARSMGVEVVDLPKNLGLSAARNIGIQRTSAPVIAFTDDDCVPPVDWVEGLINVWSCADNKVVGIGGSVSPLSTDTLSRRYVSLSNPLLPLELSLTRAQTLWARFRLYLSPPTDVNNARFVYSLVGANMSFRRSALESVGGFDEVITFGGDEEDVCRRLRKHFGDRCIWFDPSVPMAHDFEPLISDILRRSRAYGRGNGRDYCRRGGMPSIRPFPVLLFAIFVVSLPLGLRLATSMVILAPFLVFRRLLRRTSIFKERLIFPLLAAAQEFAGDAGFVEGFLEARRLKS